MDGDIMTRVGFFINDLQQHIKELHKQKSAKLTIYNQLGLVKNNHEEYEEAFQNYEDLPAILGKALSSDDPKLTSFYGNIGLVYVDIGDHENVFSAHEFQYQSLPANHPDLALSYASIGILYKACTIIPTPAHFSNVSYKLHNNHYPLAIRIFNA
ncbi:unnamed protein product [Adineta ricciae]|uniref:Uncharacterized protein n=1 Tax=Adineta ricciae TaxID=249248 RepID=A0A816FLL3_ADIRI|nr:unnamed protein product [Adineta ricciae]CAF1663229.1 unnamed protein product [Adineta ricciae]